MKRNVLFVQEMVKHYREPFYTQLHERLAARGIGMRVAYGKPRLAHAKMRDLVQLPGDIGVEVPTKWLLNDRLVYQRIGRHAAKADLVIIEQAIKYAWNVPLTLASMVGLKRVAQWGHGWNRVNGGHGAIEWLKRKAIKHCDWWFAYTPGTADFVIANGMPADKVTVTWNAFDSKPLQDAVDGVSEGDITALRAEFGIPTAAKVGIYAGGLYALKRLPALLDAAMAIKAEVADFHLLILGDGADGEMVRARAAGTDWIHVLGPTFDTRRATCLRTSDIFLCPGVLGLAVLDAFIGGMPILTMNIVGHGPEEEYLEDGVNGLRTADTAAAFGQAAADLLNDSSRLASMKQEAAKSAADYTVERMVDRFEDGILRALGEAPATAGTPAVAST